MSKIQCERQEITMGYWDSHPMAGDSPMDALYGLTDLLFTEEEQDKDFHYNDELYKTRLTEKLREATGLTFYRDQQFILPFKVAELGIQIQDEILSHTIKKMIGDGGASDRGYDSKPSNQENNYNDFQSPYDYARCLYDLWEAGMKGDFDLSKIGRGVGLFEKIDLHLNNDGSGPINTK